MSLQDSKIQIQYLGFSFIIPAYNEEKYIGECLKSVFELDGFEDNEVIVVDNGSTDGTSTVVKEKFPQVKLVSEMRKGTGWAREAGFRASSGNVLAFIDADSVLPVDWLKKSLKLMEEHKKGVAYSGPYDFALSGLTNFFIDLYYIFLMVLTCKIFNFFAIGGVLLGGNMVIKRYALEEIGGFDTHITFWGDDTLLAKRLRKIGPVYFFSSLRSSSSPRRLLYGGMFKLVILYPINAIWVMLFNRPFSKDYKAVR